MKWDSINSKTDTFLPSIGFFIINNKVISLKITQCQFQNQESMLKNWSYLIG